MSKKILVAGAGHGGLVAAAYLAEKGYKVEIFEQMKREELGYDLHDTIKNYTFDLAGIKNVDKKDIHMRKDNVFYPPSLGIEVVVDETPQERVDYEVDRKVIYRYLIDNAVEKGVKINYEQKVSGPYVVDGKVKGIVVGGKNISGDLVLDSAGMYSPVLNNLPDSYSISSNYTDNDIFHTFRGYFNLVEGKRLSILLVSTCTLNSAALRVSPGLRSPKIWRTCLSAA
jgi:flavin-dependent dehydrogenase